MNIETFVCFIFGYFIKIILINLLAIIDNTNLIEVGLPFPFISFFFLSPSVIPAYSCSKPIGGSNMTLDKSSVSETFPHDTSATFICNDGFEPESGSGDIKCTTGNWSLLTLKCKSEYLNFLLPVP